MRLWQQLDDLQFICRVCGIVLCPDDVAALVDNIKESVGVANVVERDYSYRQTRAVDLRQGFRQ